MYVEYQKHKHGHSCLKKVVRASVCRFGIPYPPMPQTEILKPLPEETQNFSLHHENFKKIRSFLLRDQSDDLISHLSIFENFLSHDQVSLSYEDYIYAIRSSLKKPQIFLKRTFAEIQVNAYNKHILSMQRANMDIQLILDPFPCCSYIINYINISKLMREAANDIRRGNSSIRQKLQYLGHKFVSGTEISAQEAVYCCLGLALSESSNKCVHVQAADTWRRSIRGLDPRIVRVSKKQIPCNEHRLDQHRIACWKERRTGLGELQLEVVGIAGSSSRRGIHWLEEVHV